MGKSESELLGDFLKVITAILTLLAAWTGLRVARLQKAAALDATTAPHTTPPLKKALV